MEIISPAGLYPKHVNGDPQTRTVVTAAPVSELSITKCPSVLPAAKATPNGWKLNDIHSKGTFEKNSH